MKQTIIFYLIFFFFYYCYCFEERTTIIGPFTVEPNNHHLQTVDGPDWLKNLKKPIAITSYYVRLRDSNGNDLSQSEAYVHHLLIRSKFSRNIPCPELPGNMILASGADLAFAEIPNPYAYKIKPGDQWNVNFQVDNPSLINTITYQIEYTVITQDWNENLIEIEGYLNSVTGCDYTSNGFKVKKNLQADSFYFSTDVLSTFSGYMILVGGHLHRGAKSISITRQSTNESLFIANAHYDYPSNSDFLTSIDKTIQHIPFTLLEPIQLTAIYDCSKDYYGAMGFIFAFVVVTDYHNHKIDREIYSGYKYNDKPIIQELNNKNEPIIEEIINRDSIKQEKSKDQLLSENILNIGLLGVFIITLLIISLKKPFNVKFFVFFLILSIIILTFRMLYEG